MNLFFLFFLPFFITEDVVWLTNFEDAKKLAVEKNEMILLNFSGSDWCGPCMRMRKEIFQSNEFTLYAKGKLVLVNADFPRNRKHRLSKLQEMHNNNLADKYNPAGKFPFTILLNPQGEKIKEWDGLPAFGPAEYVKQLIHFSETGR